MRDFFLWMRALYFTSSELLITNTRLLPLKGLEEPGQFLKLSYDAILHFLFSLECYKLFVHR